MINNNITEEQEDVYLSKLADEAMEDYLANPVSYTLDEVEDELGIAQE